MSATEIRPTSVRSHSLSKARQSVSDLVWSAHHATTPLARTMALAQLREIEAAAVAAVNLVGGWEDSR
jgi:hypothetical protein